MASKITVHRVQQGEAKVGCDPRGVQILFKESRLHEKSPNLVYLGDLLKKHDFQVKEGDRIADTPLGYLCVTRAGGTVTREDVLAVLMEDQEIDLSNVNLPEGNQGSE